MGSLTLTEYEQAMRQGLMGLEKELPQSVSPFMLDVLLGAKLLQKRESFIQRFGHAIPSQEALETIALHGPILEIGAGSGYWAYEIRKTKVDIVATDLFPVGNNSYRFTQQWVPDIEKLEAIEAIRKFADRTLLLVWPCYGRSWAAEALREYKNEVVLYVGEGKGGNCADDDFHTILNNQFHRDTLINIPQWFSMNDFMGVYSRKRNSH